MFTFLKIATLFFPLNYKVQNGSSYLIPNKFHYLTKLNKNISRINYNVYKSVSSFTNLFFLLVRRKVLNHQNLETRVWQDYLASEAPVCWMVSHAHKSLLSCTQLECLGFSLLKECGKNAYLLTRMAPMPESNFFGIKLYVHLNCVF